jgi:hypothetical protein
MMHLLKKATVSLKSTIPTFVLVAGFAVLGYSQDSFDDLPAKVDALISDAYRSAAAEFPCKLKTRGKPKMLRWQDVDKCLNNANDRVDWDGLSQKLQVIRDRDRFQRIDISSAVEASLSAHAIPFDKIFVVKEIEALLPLSNSLLKFLPADSLLNLPVFNKSGERVGTFSGVYTYERMGGLAAANSYRMSFFQYTDLNGKMQTPASGGRLLLDSYGIPWKGAISQPGFRLPSDRLIAKH